MVSHLLYQALLSLGLAVAVAVHSYQQVELVELAVVELEVVFLTVHKLAELELQTQAVAAVVLPITVFLLRSPVATVVPVL
jgi:hypothetical protein